MKKDKKSTIKVAKSIVGIMEAVDKKTLANLNIEDVSPYLGTEGTLGGVIFELKQDMGIVIELNLNCTHNVYFVTNLKVINEEQSEDGGIDAEGKCKLLYVTKEITSVKAMKWIKFVANKLDLFMSDDEKLQRFLASKGISLN